MKKPVERVLDCVVSVLAIVMGATALPALAQTYPGNQRGQARLAAMGTAPHC